MELRQYEAVLAFKPQISEDQLKNIIGRIEKKITESGGAIEEIDKKGVRRLPFRFQKHKSINEANYIVIYFKAPSKVPGLVREQVRVIEDIVRFTVDQSMGPKKQLAETPEAKEEDSEAVEIPVSMLEGSASPENLSGQS